MLEITRNYLKPLKTVYMYYADCIKLFTELIYLDTHMFEICVRIVNSLCVHGTYRFNIQCVQIIKECVHTQRILISNAVIFTLSLYYNHCHGKQVRD